MMKIIIILSVVFIFNSCTKSDAPIDTSIPNCIQEIIDDPNLSKDLKTVRVQNVNKELHYWLNTDFTHFDGVEYIINSRCDTICGFCGECIPADCSKEYDEIWTIIWEK
ncbi:MAG TPA: hypothetical protein P5235_09100 [Saprospiraceae bacterium]|nr:hypothetical protein [Saprospiraceae bacterium]